MSVGGGEMGSLEEEVLCICLHGLGCSPLLNGLKIPASWRRILKTEPGLQNALVKK
jgi:hypothetical protein